MATYKDAVRWIADNDDPSDTDPEVVSGMVTVALVSDLFGKDPEKVARDILAYRKRPSCPICGHLMSPKGRGYVCPECKARLSK